MTSGQEMQWVYSYNPGAHTCTRSSDGLARMPIQKDFSSRFELIRRWVGE